MESNDKNIPYGSCDLLRRNGTGFGLRLSLDLRFEAKMLYVAVSRKRTAWPLQAYAVLDNKTGAELCGIIGAELSGFFA